MNLESVIQSEMKREKQTLYINAYMWDLEIWYRWPTCRGGIKKQIWRMDLRGRREWDELGEYSWHIHTTTHEIDSQWEAAAELTELSSVLGDDPETWDGTGGRKVPWGYMRT